MIGDSMKHKLQAEARKAEINLKEANLKKILQEIVDNRGISRAQIARNTMLSRTTVSMLTEEMLEDGLIFTNGTGVIDTTGRKPTRLEINPDYAQIVTVVLRQSEMRYVLYNMALEPIEVFSCPIEYRNGFACDILDTIKQRSKLLDWEKCACFCISTSSTILTDTYELLSTIMDIAPGYNFLKDLRARLGQIPIFASNGSPMLAYAEKKFGEKRDISNLIYINIAEGLGAGIIMDDKLFKGAYGRAGEFGHMSIDIKGPACPCGKRGCIDCYLKKSAILESFQKAAEGGHSLMSSKPISYGSICSALEAGDAVAMSVATDLCEKLAFAISNLICVFNPERIVLGGGIQELGNVFFRLVNDFVMASASKGTMWARKLSIAYTFLDEWAENLGIAKYFLDKVFKFPFFCEGQMFL